MQSLLNEFCNWKNLIKATNEATVYFSALGCFLFFWGESMEIKVYQQIKAILHSTTQIQY